MTTYYNDPMEGYKQQIDILKNEQPFYRTQLEVMINRVPESGLYDHNYDKFEIFCNHLVRGVKSSPRSNYLREVNQKITDLYQNVQEVKWLLTYISDSRFRVKISQLLNNTWENFDISAEEFINSPLITNLIPRYESSIKRDYENLINIISLYNAMQMLSYGPIYRKYKANEYIINAPEIENSPGYQKIIDGITANSSSEKLIRQRIDRLIRNDRRKRAAALKQRPILSSKLDKSPHYKYWLLAHKIWNRYNIKQISEEFNHYDKQIGADRNKRGAAYEKNKSKYAVDLVLDALVPQAQVRYIYLTNDLSIPLIYFPKIYNEHISGYTFNYDRTYPPWLLNSFSVKTLYDTDEWDIEYTYETTCFWMTPSSRIGEIDILLLAKFTKIFPSSINIGELLRDTGLNITINVLDDDFQKITITHVLSVIEMKSKCFDIGSGFRQHETKMIIPDSYILTSDQPLNIFYQNATDTYDTHNPNPPIFVITLIPDNDFSIGLPGKLVLDISNIIFSDLEILQDKDRLNQLMDVIIKKHETFLSPIDILRKYWYKLFIIS